MDSDSINTTPSPSANNCKDFSRKKRRSAKLKQCKLDARREQWLSHSAVKNKGCCKEGTNGGDLKQRPQGETDCLLENLEMSRRGEANRGGETGLVQHESDSESLPSNSPMNSILLEGTVADALAADDDKREMERNNNNRENPFLGSTPEHEQNPQLGLKGEGSDLRNAKPECPRMVQRVTGSSRAWRADDAFRPQSLPNLSKQRSFPNTDRHFGQRGVPWIHSSTFTVPSSCPICYEDLDFTDSSFFPCLCGFRLCLFCHKRILEEDGRCPGCRKQYEQDPMEAEASIQEGSLTFRLARSSSMFARS
ncbi:Zinc finger, RING/FYVE/PHD-type [Corchorus capsularis]|uniref:Zinc finger, RING/FYVE/PHD-type n=1 Tax=Corchorus capsularis TaxID=210143 RepID=A0A1R3I4Q5_COCAP|nr:Zinc finger, RING/FYVE/PHD-type [Corchorus capsularis]